MNNPTIKSTAAKEKERTSAAVGDWRAGRELERRDDQREEAERKGAEERAMGQYYLFHPTFPVSGGWTAYSWYGSVLSSVR